MRSIFSGEAISPYSSVREEYNRLCQLDCGRREFARQCTSMRAQQRELSETVFLQLVANFATILHLCEMDDDIKAAKVLLVLSFTFRCEDKFLYQDLLHLTIWKSMRFWEAAFLYSVHIERKSRSQDNTCFRDQTQDQRNDSAELQKNTFFGHLSSFISNMTAFGVTANDIVTFRDKMFVMSELDPEQIEMIKQMSPPVKMETNENLIFERFKIRSKSILTSVSKGFQLG